MKRKVRGVSTPKQVTYANLFMFFILLNACEDVAL